MAPKRQIQFAGYTWEVKRSEEHIAGPGPNYFGDQAENVALTEDGSLLLSIQHMEGRWVCAEVVLEQPLGFGEYAFTLTSPVVGLSGPVVCAAFLYENDSQEIDIEFSKNMVGKNRGQYVIQPGSVRNNLAVFPIRQELGMGPTAHSILWLPNEVQFKSWSIDSGGDRNLIHEWTYSSKGIISPEHARFIFNIWLFRGKYPNRPERMQIQSFSFTPFRKTDLLD